MLRHLAARETAVHHPLKISPAPLGGDVLHTNHLIRLRALAALDDVKFDLIALFQALIAVDLNGAVMNEHICPTFAPKEPVPFCIVKPLNNSPILRQCCSPRSFTACRPRHRHRDYDANSPPDVFSPSSHSRSHSSQSFDIRFNPPPLRRTPSGPSCVQPRISMNPLHVRQTVVTGNSTTAGTYHLAGKTSPTATPCILAKVFPE